MPQRAETQGRSEEYLGRWIRDRNISRDRLVLATKVSNFQLCIVYHIVKISYKDVSFDSFEWYSIQLITNICFIALLESLIGL